MALHSSAWFSFNGIECSQVSAHDAVFPRHLHDEYVISANLTGVEQIWLAGKSAEVKAGQVTLYNPATLQASRFDHQGVNFISVHLPQSLLQNLATQHNLTSHHQAPALREGVLDEPRLFSALCRFAQASSCDSLTEQQQQLLSLCSELLQPAPPADPAEHRLVARVKEALLATLEIKPSLDDLASQAGVSKYYLVRCFTRHTGLPPLQYHMQLRLHRARQLLRNRVHPLEAALELGFYDQSHFINAFRKVMGVTPHDYAQQRVQRSINSR
ncbi:AraC family transcriptional regulator [Pantoea conspicua]|uniref:AraC family transcriptional regulator n=1 Tax=Pantoea conspicua TaxID=472705 RepID=A0A1X1BYV0_9GAMM|nr:AraC family transcriptional regulator [Pantoea conspicua]ORM54142.1 AraC family transcriptional regulator [Pantoea conspicua]